MTSTAPRVALPDRASLAPDVDQLLGLASDADGTPLLTVHALAHHPPLLAPFLGWAAALALEGALAPRDHELLALRTAHLCDSQFEWDEHCGYASNAGLTAEEIERVRLGAEEPGWSEHDAVLLRVADELHMTNTVSDATLAESVAGFPPAALIEMLYVVGQYTMLSMVANALLGRS